VAQNGNGVTTVNPNRKHEKQAEEERVWAEEQLTWSRK